MKYAAIGLLLSLAAAWAVVAVTGDGSFKRMVTLSGVYSVCRPDGYDVVCFLDADGKEGGLFCMALSEAGGECRK